MKKRIPSAVKKVVMQYVFDGMIISEYGTIFGMHIRDVARKLRKVEPTGQRHGHDIYHIKDAAPYLMKPVVNVEEWIKKLRPNDLPPFLLKEFWAGQRTKQQFEKEAGQLWRTENVIEVFATCFKNLRSQILLFADQIEGQTELTPQHRKLIEKQCDSLIIMCRKNLLKRKANVKADDEDERTIEGISDG